MDHAGADRFVRELVDNDECAQAFVLAIRGIRNKAIETQIDRRNFIQAEGLGR